MWGEHFRRVGGGEVKKFGELKIFLYAK